MAERDNNNRYTINSIIRAKNILQLLAQEVTGLRIGELAKRLDLDRTTVFRVVVTLEQCGFIERIGESKSYKLGVGLFEIGSAYIRSTDIHSIARPIMIDLSHRVREGVHWAILSGEKAVCIDKIESPRGLGTTSKIGRAVPLNSGSVGKVLLAFQSTEAREHLLDTLELARFTDRTITSPDTMRAEIERIRRKGFCLSLGEGEVDMACIAAPIFDHTARVSAGLSVGGHIQRFEDTDNARKLTAQLIDAARQISEKLGCAEIPEFETAA
ncbi:MAG: IclR family transcriptional regulator [Rhodospirillales bacterium]|jgi:IclR family transcriptional regulator, KDG regulon repressor|nr:IclR family transcriptional regulator [Rhodospirillales bacterium]